MRKDILEQKEIILELIEKYRPKSHICKILKCRPSTLERALKILNITYLGNKGSVGYRKQRYTISALELSKREVVTSDFYKKKLIKEGIRKDECDICKLNIWMGKKIPLELHHIDGNRFNNGFDNVQILCPNCHAQTSNYGSKNRHKIEINDEILNKDNILFEREISEEDKVKEKFFKYKFCECGKRINYQNEKCRECYNKYKKENKLGRKIKDRPSIEFLIHEVNEIGYSATGRKYGVTDNAIKKWLGDLAPKIQKKEIRNVGKPNCVDCGKEIDYNSDRCKSCKDIKSRIYEIPNIDILKDDFFILGITNCAKKYGVSRQTLSKWLKKYEII